jgi:hypothetical protein
VRFRADVGGIAVIDVKGVIKRLVEAGEGVGIRINGDPIPVFDRVGPEVVKAGDVIGMAVGVNDGIEAGNPGPEGLGAEVGRGVDDHAEFVVLKPDRRSEAAVAGVVGGANPALAGEHGDALRGTGSEEG